MSGWSTLPTITADELEAKATVFAKDFADHLDIFNRAFPMSAIGEGCVAGTDEPHPQQCIDHCKEVYYRCMASSHVIIPS